MGGYAHHEPTVYIVRWADGVTKVGITTKQRWRTFVIRGAVVMALYQFGDYMAASSVESRSLGRLRVSAAPAFGSKADSEAHMGASGGGYMECFVLASDQLTNFMRSTREFALDRGGEIKHFIDREGGVMATATHVFYSTDKEAWLPAFSITSDEEAARINKIIGSKFYVRKVALAAA